MHSSGCDRVAADVTGDAASDGVDPDVVDTLERVVRSLGDELAFFRRRAIDAERRVRDVLAQQANASSVGPTASAAAARLAEADRERIAALESENAELRARLIDAADRARSVASRMRFARQQDEAAAADRTA